LTHRLRRNTSIIFISIVLLTACTPSPTPPPPFAPSATPVTATAAANLAATPTPEPTLTPTPTPTPIELVVCQKDAPLSLYLYGDSPSARAGLFDALFDGPIDSVGYAYQPVILESLPSLENGGASVTEVEVHPGDRVVDAVTNQIVPLGEGVQLAQPDGSQIAYTGSDPAHTLQISAAFTLKPGLLWSDGQPLTADDSAFSLDIAASPDTPLSHFVTDRTAHYDVIDSRTVRWTGLPGWRDTQFFLRFWTPLPRHLYGRLSAAELLADADAARRPLGWGPFRLGPGGWNPDDQRLTLIRNPNYFRAAEGLPRVDKVTFRFGLDNEQILSEMLARRCDIGAEESDFSGQISFLLQAQAGKILAPQFVPGNSFEHLDFGIQPADDYKRAAGNDLFQDVRVRQAVAYCLDRQALVRQLLSGLAEVPAAYLPAHHPLYAAEAVTLYPFDPAQGQALLEAAGWADKDGDGIRDASGGKRKLSVDYASGPAGSPFRDALMQFVQTQLHDNCGIELRPKPYTPDDLYAPWPSGVLFGRKFDLGEFPWRTGIEPPCELYLTENIPSDQNPGGANDAGYSNPAFDEACRAARNALDDATRRARHAEALAIFTQDLPSLPLFLRVKVGVALPRVNGYQLDSTASSDLWNIEAISLSAP
jgi:peptide/nickel transport system substrate-binding protein